jgi:hypothetical protein
MSGGGSLMRQICSLSDPFCKASQGAKYPDTTSLKTIVWDVEQFITLTTDASGRAGAVFGSDPGSNYSTVNSWATTTMQINSSGTPSAFANWTNWGSVNGVQWRCVSYGVQARSIMSAMNNQGSIGIAAVPATSGTLSTLTLDLDSANFSANTRISASMGQELSAVARTDGTVSKQFKTPAAAGGNTATSYGNDVLIVYIVGGPASQASVQIRIVAHYELTFGSSTVFNQIATPGAQDSVPAKAGADFVQRTVDQVIVGGSKEVERRVSGAASSFGAYLARTAMGAVGGLIGGYIGGPTGASVGSAIGSHSMGMIMDVD